MISADQTREEPRTVLLWKAPLAEPEPVAVLAYKDQRYHIPYTLMHWITGWLACGMHGTFAPPVACWNTSDAFRALEEQMRYDALSAEARSQILVMPKGWDGET